MVLQYALLPTPLTASERGRLIVCWRNINGALVTGGTTHATWIGFAWDPRARACVVEHSLKVPTGTSCGLGSVTAMIRLTCSRVMSEQILTLPVLSTGLT